MGEGERLSTLEVGEGPGQSEDPVHPAQGEVPTLQGAHEPAAERCTQSAVGAPEEGAWYLGIEPPGSTRQSALRGTPGPQHPLRHHGAGLAARRAGEIRGTDRCHLDLDVHPVQQRSGQPREVAPPLQGRAGALQSPATGLAARAGVGCQNELEGGWVAGPSSHTVNGDRPGLQGLTQTVQDPGTELGGLVEEQHAAVGQGDVPGAR